MSDKLPDWNREHFHPTSDEALVFYVVFGRLDMSQPASRAKHGLAGIPPGVQVLQYGPDAHPDVVDGFREGYLWTELQKEQPSLAATLEQQRHCVAIKGLVPDSDTLNYFRDAIGLVHYLCDCGGVGVYDPQMFKYWSPEDWETEAKDTSGAWARRHTVIIYSQESDGEWFHTRGMRKFARPDLSVHGVTQEYRSAVIQLINRFIDLQADGGVIEDGMRIQMQSLPDGMVCEHRGDLEDPDFNNRHVEILWSA